MFWLNSAITTVIVQDKGLLDTYAIPQHRINQSINQSIIQSIIQPINQPINKSINQPINQSINQSINVITVNDEVFCGRQVAADLPLP